MVSEQSVLRSNQAHKPIVAPGARLRLSFSLCEKISNRIKTNKTEESIMPIEFGSFSLGAIAGGIVIGIANHFLSKSRNKEDRTIAEFNKAAKDFRDAFLPEVTFLKHNANIGGLGSSNDLFEILQFAYVHRHLKALDVFKTYLTANDRIAVDKAWKEYCYHSDNQNILFLEQYSWKVANKGKDYEKRLKDVALSRIEKILQFAEPK